VETIIKTQEISENVRNENIPHLLALYSKIRRILENFHSDYVIIKVLDIPDDISETDLREAFKDYEMDGFVL
jgi:hypothetical protein